MSDDLAAVRSAVLTVTPHELGESRARVKALITVPRRAPVPWRVPVLAAALVLAVALSVAWYLQGRSPAPVAAPPGLDVSAVFDQLAATASRDTPVVPDGDDVIYVEENGVSSDFSKDPPIRFLVRVEHWYRPQGMVHFRMRAYEHTLITPYRDLREGDLTLYDPARQSNPGPNLQYPTPAWIAALPTTPAAMRAVMTAASAPMRGDWPVEHGIWEGMRTFLPGSDPQLPPAARTALYQTLAGLRGLTAYRIEIAGRPVMSVRMFDRGGFSELLFDERTGHFIGTGSGEKGLPMVTRTPLPVPDIPLEPTITVRSISTCTLVSPDQVPA